jgi:hypothetical protein
VRFTPPDEDLVEAYEKRKASFKQQLYQDAIEAIEEAEEEGEETDPVEVAQEIAEGDIMDYVSYHGTTGKPYINKDLIRTGLDISHSDARAVKAILEQTFSQEQLEDES